MPRRRDQAARRSQLIEAAAQAVLEHGSTNARLRDIADHAGLTPASVLYYYPDLDELLAAVFEQGTTTYIDRRQEAVERRSTARAKLAACICSGVPFPGEAESTSRLLYELLPVIFRNDAAAAQQKRFISEQTRIYQQVLEQGEISGEFQLTARSAFLARSLVALEDGYAIDVLSGAATADQVAGILLRHAGLFTGARLRRNGPPRKDVTSPAGC